MHGESFAKKMLTLPTGLHIDEGSVQAPGIGKKNHRKLSRLQ